MSSTILYKFRSSTTFEALSLRGLSVRLFDVKKAIVKAKKLDGGMDFELEVQDATTNQPYIDESMILPRGTRVIVHRVGAPKGQGFVARMQRAEAGMALQGPASTSSNNSSGYYTIQSHVDNDDDMISTSRVADERELAALMAATETPSVNATAGINRPFVGATASSSFRMAGNTVPPTGRLPSIPRPPSNHIRPNADPEIRAQEQLGMPKKRATGIPRTFLNLSAPSNTDGISEDMDSLPRLQPNAIGFDELVHRGGGQSERASGRDLEYALKLTATTIPEHLQCGICRSVAKNAMLLPWDAEGRTTCETCIRDSLTQNGFRCPLTGNEGVSPDDLIPNMPLRKAVDFFVQGVMDKMEEIVQHQVDEPDYEEDIALSSKDFEGETGDKGVIVSKKTIKEHRSKRNDDDDPFAAGEDDFGGDVFAVEAPDTVQEETVAVEKVVKNSSEKKTSKNSSIIDTTNLSQKKSESDAPIEQKNDIPAKSASKTEPPKESTATQDRRKQRTLPAGYTMGPAMGATATSSPVVQVNRVDDPSSSGGSRGRGGWNTDRGGFRGRGGRGGRFPEKGSKEELEVPRGSGVSGRDSANQSADRAYEVSLYEYVCEVSV
jgi:DWNN domain